MANLSYYWKRSATEITWTIAYRESTFDILENNEVPFNIKSEKEGFWGADPFLFEHNGDIYLFYELYIKDKGKGVIAVSKYDNGSFTSPQIVIEERFHMSFPCVFMLKGKIYMMPETGSVNKLYLYECEEFPLKWVRKKTLLDNVNTSDTIVYQDNKDVWVIVSMLKGSACSAQNYIYKMDAIKLQMSLCCIQEEVGECGYRNAGFIFQHFDQLVRPGQNCRNKQYGKSLFFWKVNEINESRFSELLLKETKVEDLKIKSKINFVGVHTYNRIKNIEVVDLKITKKRSINNRLSILLKIIIDYVIHKYLGK